MAAHIKYLGELAKIISGLTLREKPSHDPLGKVRLIQVRDVGNPYPEINDNLLQIPLTAVPPQQLLHPNDILLLAKGPHNPALLYTKSWDYAAAVSFFFRLRIYDPACTHPGYLAWYLNSAPGQAALLSLRQGSSVAGITKPLLAGLEIPVPDLTTQQRIAHVAAAQLRETKLTDTLRAKRAQAIEQALLNQLHHD
jgi:restriction endonuclease S subunit